MVARFNLHLQGILFICGLNSHSQKVDNRWSEVFALAGFVAWLSRVCALLPSGWHVLGFLLLAQAVAGLLHVQITISHFSMAVYDGVTFTGDEDSWPVTQLAT